MGKNERQDSDSLFLNLFFRTSNTVTDEEVAYFREHPEQIDEITAPIYIHKIFLWGGTLLGVVLVACAKLLKFSALLSFLSEGVREFTVDIVYESGVALIGAAVTAYVLGVVLNRQQENAAEWRARIRERIEG